MELKKFLKSKRGLIVYFSYLSIIVIMLANIYISVYNYQDSFEKKGLESKVFLGHYATVSQPYDMILLWFLMIWIYEMNGYITFWEYKTNYYTILISKIGFQKYFLTKIFKNFLIIFVGMFIICIISYFLSVFISIIGGIDYHLLLLDYKGDIDIGTKFESTYPFTSLMMHYLIFSFMAGLFSTFINCMLFITKDMKVTLAISTLFGYILILGRQHIDFAILIQPFILHEYNYMYKFDSFITITLIIIIFNIFTYFYLRRRDYV